MNVFAHNLNYIIACWSGMRRVNPKSYINDRHIFIQKHLERLSQLKHSIDQITMVINHNPDEPKCFRDFINALPTHMGTTKIEILDRPNIGYSYGAYSDAFNKYRDFKYYMLMEDDYTFTIDDFDSILLSKLESDPKYGFASFWLCKSTKREMLERIDKLDVKDKKPTIDTINKFFPDKFVYPRIMVGLVRNEVLTAIWNEFNELPYSRGNTHSECKIEGQFGLPAAMQKVGWKIIDVNCDYRVAAYSPVGETIKNGPQDKPLILVPVQSL
jgi:hypothetical protein